jgi:hypothetical protein
LERYPVCTYAHCVAQTALLFIETELLFNNLNAVKVVKPSTTRNLRTAKVVWPITIFKIMKFSKFLILSILLPLSACMTPEQQRRYEQNVQNEKVNKCNSYGYRQGSQAFGNCMMQLERRANLEESCNNVFLSAFASADPSRGTGYAGSVASQAQSDCLAGRPIRTEPKPINTTCTRNGNRTECVSQ